MSYSPVTDFLALLRSTAGGVRSERMPGLDFVVAAFARMGFMTLYVGQNAPTVNQATTAWFKPALPSWTTEGVLYLWDSSVNAYVAATPTLWANMYAPPGRLFQSLTVANNVIGAGVTLAAVQRVAPANTNITLPTLTGQLATGRNLRIVDFSTGVVAHDIAIVTPDGATIMQQATWHLLSTADQLAGIELIPSLDLNTWAIAP